MGAAAGRGVKRRRGMVVGEVRWGLGERRGLHVKQLSLTHTMPAMHAPTPLQVHSLRCWLPMQPHTTPGIPLADNAGTHTYKGTQAHAQAQLHSLQQHTLTHLCSIIAAS